jgi:hypothetical protein
MRTPLIKFAAKEDISVRFVYKEAAAGRLVLTKVGSRTFVDDADAEAWRALAPKVNGTAGDIALKTAVAKLEELAKAVADGQVDRALVADRLASLARRTGLALELIE